MSLLVNPPVGAVKVYDYVKLQDFFFEILKAHEASQGALFPEYRFEVTKNKSVAWIDANVKNGLVNIIAPIVGSEQSTNVDKQQVVTYKFEVFWRSGDDTAGNEADELATEYVQYLAANVEFVLNALYNLIPNTIDYGNVQFQDITAAYGRPEVIGESSDVFGVGSLDLKTVIIYKYDDSLWPNLAKLVADLGYTTAEFTPNP